MRLRATLQFKTTPEHRYHEEDRLFTFENTYTFYDDRDINDCKQVIKEDMLEVVSYDGSVNIINLTIERV